MAVRKCGVLTTAHHQQHLCWILCDILNPCWAARPGSRLSRPEFFWRMILLRSPHSLESAWSRFGYFGPAECCGRPPMERPDGQIEVASESAGRVGTLESAGPSEADFPGRRGSKKSDFESRFLGRLCSTSCESDRLRAILGEQYPRFHELQGQHISTTCYRANIDKNIYKNNTLKGT